MSLSFDHPWYLVLLALVPVIWLLSYRGLSGLGSLRRIFALAVRTGVLVLIILALAQVQSVWTSPRLTVLYLLDQSLSIPEPQRQMMADFVKQSVAQHRDAKRQDRAGVIVFAKDAAVEYPPVDENIVLADKLETSLDATHTNLESALKLAAATLPADSASRVVLVTDGNENLGDAYAQAQQLTEKGIGIDVVPLRYSGRSD
ncbi:MAG TPA: VWA domain-containing protein, partial [Pirellulales bacterium]